MKINFPVKNFAIGIIGGTGGIGKWFADFFTGEGHTVRVSGRAEGISIPEFAASCRIVIVAVPIAATLDIIREVGPLLPEDALLMDLTSLKEEPVRAMLAASRAEVIGCHPLFGPDVPSLADQNIVLCPARGDRWLGFLQGIFVKNGARIRVTTPAEHDRMMALIQGLTHLDTILMGLTLRDSGVEPSELEAFSTPVFRTKRAIIEKVFGPRPGLYAGILTENPNITEVVERHERNLSLLKELVRKRDTAGLAALLKKT
ncbi:MAG: prephenate dehydrogenase/arogenate dehydrogenase family protein [Proteobacteria bacterium]|nr:prephenate dehydrogenase/arogenate dehydrogenase family protein [Pseudomonadota bacterium]MBU1743708.1 prephenate dehydrogenase/arogenate dehydrogenase family protein [Pseudomonadota bacterium]